MMSEATWLHTLPKAWVWAAGLDFAAAVLHLAIIAGGPAWYRFFGAGAKMAAMASRGHPWPALLTSLIAGVLCVFGAYAMQAGGHFPALPWPKTILWAITSVYAFRAVAPLLLAPFVPAIRNGFTWWSSAVCGAFAAAHFMAVS